MEYGLIGEKLGHSFSKSIHEKLADYQYDLMPLTRDEFKTFMEKKDFKAINVTIPYKRDVLPYLSEIDGNAESIGAVNTIVNKNGTLKGYNTDFNGFLYMLEHHNIKAEGKKVLILGNGGAAQAVIAVFRHLKAGQIIIVDVVPGRGAITYEECKKQHLDAQIIANASPVGMYPNVEASPIDVSLFSNCEAVLDVIYNPLKTKLTLQADELGIPSVNGLEMLVAQAKYAVEFFLDKKIDDSRIETIYHDIYEEMKK